MKHARATVTSKRLRASKYKYVSYISLIQNGKESKGWRAHIPNYHNGKNWSKFFTNERLAAIEVDKQLIKIGKNPINILIRN